MKKIFLTFLIILLVSSFCFAGSKRKKKNNGFFDHRVVELKTDIPVNFSNNVFGLFDFFKKEIEIDLPKIASEIPENGFNTILSTNPNVGLNINLANFLKVGVNAGVNIYGDLNLSKDFFTFLGTGNELYKDMDFVISSNFDVFAYVNANVGLTISKLTLGIAPSIFVPVANFHTNELGIKFKNTQEGLISLKFVGDMNLYTFKDFGFSNGFFGNMQFDTSTLWQEIFDSMGIDCEFFGGWQLFDNLNVMVNCRVPIVPGKLYYKTPINMHASVETSLMDIFSGEGLSDMFDYGFGEMQTTDETTIINRPLKANLSLCYKPLGNFFTLDLKGGVGVNHPFLDDFSVYPEYLVGVKLSLLNIISARVCTEYTDKIFIHSIDATVNVRLVELNVGVQFSSSDFVKSLQGTGFGAHIIYCIGF